MADELTVPAAPKFLPAAKQEEWKKAYAAALKKAQSDYPDQVSAQAQYALCEANRLLQMPEVKSYKDAMALEPHTFIQREQVDVEGAPVLRLIMADGKKYQFSVPQKPADK